MLAINKKEKFFFLKFLRKIMSNSKDIPILSDEEIERLRESPAEFLKLPNDVKKPILLKFAHPEDGEKFVYRKYPTSKFKFINHESDSIVKRNLTLYLSNLLQRKMYKLIRLLMNFFRIEIVYFYVSDDTFLQLLPSLMNYFRYGCCSEVSYILYDNSYCNIWFTGRPGDFLDILLTLDEDLFRQIHNNEFCPKFNTIQIMEEVLTIIRCSSLGKAIPTNTSSDIQLSSEFVKLANKLSVILQKISDNPEIEEVLSYDNLIHPSFVPVYPIEYDYRMTYEDDLLEKRARFAYIKHHVFSKIPIPLWSRERYKYCSPLFKSQILTVICMQRFRHSQFTIHKNLLKNLFDYMYFNYMMEIENEIIRLRTNMEPLLKLYNSDSKDDKNTFYDILLEEGFLSNPSSVYYNVKAFAKHKMGLLEEEDYEHYRDTLIEEMPKWKSLESIIEKLERKFEDAYAFVGKKLKYVAAEYILNRCKEKNISLVDLKHGRVNLDEIV